MRICAFCLLSICIFPPLFAQDIYNWVLVSDRRANTEILSFILAEDYDDANTAIMALGQRKDSYVADIIFALFDIYSHLPLYRNQALLTALLNSLFSAVDEAQSKERININKEAIDFLIKELPTIENSDLRVEIMKIIPLTSNKLHHAYLAAQGNKLAWILKNKQGQVAPDLDQELLVFLDTVEKIRNKDFTEICLSIVERSRNRQVVQKARVVVKKLLHKD